MATSVATAAGAPGAPPPPTHQDHQSGAGLLLVLAGLGAAGAAAWLLTHRKTASPPATSAQHFTAGSANPSLVTPSGRGLPGPGMIPCYGKVDPHSVGGVTTTIGAGPLGLATGIPWGQPLTQAGPIIDAPWPNAPGVAGVGEWIPTDYHGCLASLADVTVA